MDRSRSSHVRLKIVALLASMTALWGFAAYVTVQDGLNVLFVRQLDDRIGQPTEALVEAVQEERRVSVVVRATETSGAPVDSALVERLEHARLRTDSAVRRWQREQDRLGLWGAGAALRERLDDTGDIIAELPGLRDQIDRGELDWRAVHEWYSEAAGTGMEIYRAMSSIDDEEIARRSRALVTLTDGRELLARQDAVVAGALAEGALTRQDLTTLTMLIGARDELYDRAYSDLAPADQETLRVVRDGEGFAALDLREQELIAAGEGAPPIAAHDWDTTAGTVLTELREVEHEVTDSTLAQAGPVATAVIVRLVLAGGLGLLAVIAAVVVAVTTARSLVRQLERLRDAARTLAEDRLPRVVDRLSHGEPVDVAAEAPPLRFGNDEIGQVGQAFNAVQQTAVQAAVQQADLRRGVRDVFLSLARRTQNLVHKQIGVLDRMERRDVTDEEMADLYRVDHLATRMRRNAENLIVLSGAAPGRTWRRPVPMIDVIRGAIAEVEDYQRVTLLPVQAGALEGRVVGDMVHLLAELIENAVSYSPPYAMVGVSGQRVAHGFVVEIEDRGLGMGDAELSAANRQLAEPPDFSLADASRLGHYVVAKLAQRHGVRVHLRTSPYGGITAIVLLPQEMIIDADEPEPSPGRAGSDPEAPVPPMPRRERAQPSLPTPSGSASTPSEPTPSGPSPSASSPSASSPSASTPSEPSPSASTPSEPSAARPPMPDGPVAGRPTAGASATGTPADGDLERTTPGGLPFRVRQASIPPQLADDPGGEEVSARDPEQVRRAMSAYQRGTRRGRDAAAGPSPRAQETPDGQSGAREEG